MSLRRRAGSDDRIAQALREVPRELFLPPDQLRHARDDRPLPIGQGQTNSQPSTVATMLWLLDVHPGHRVLDVGAGSGWTTALLAWLVGPEGQVVGVELEPDLVQAGSRSLAGTGQPWASILTADPHQLGHRDGAPYDRILVSAMAVDIPAELIGQLSRDDGVLVLPVAGRMVRVSRRGGETDIERLGHYRFVPLR